MTIELHDGTIRVHELQCDTKFNLVYHHSLKNINFKLILRNYQPTVDSLIARRLLNLKVTELDDVKALQNKLTIASNKQWKSMKSMVPGVITGAGTDIVIGGKHRFGGLRYYIEKTITFPKHVSVQLSATFVTSEHIQINKHFLLMYLDDVPIQSVHAVHGNNTMTVELPHTKESSTVKLQMTGDGLSSSMWWSLKSFKVAITQNHLQH